MTRPARVLCCSALALALAACKGTTAPDDGGDPADVELAADGEEESAASAQSTNIANIVFSAVSSQDPNAAADEVAPPIKVWPAGCVTKAKDPTNPLVAHVTFKDCTGPFGLIHLNGEVIATFSAGAGGALHVVFAGKSLTANGHPLTYSATAEVTVAGATRTVDWEGAWTATTAKGKTVAHTSALTIVVDTMAGCRTANGTAVTSVEQREVDTTVKDLKICADTSGDACPSGEVTHTGKVSGKSVSVAFDGSNQAAVTGPSGHTFDVPLVCTAAM